jgi:hypothetical protein
MTTQRWWDWLDLGDSEGSLDRPSDLLGWSVPPEVDLDGEWLIFRRPIRTLQSGRRVLPLRKVKAGANLLSEFVTLQDASVDRILEYARKYGPLGLCKHGEPIHRLDPNGCPRLVSVSREPGKLREAGQLREAVQWWRSLAGDAYALLNVSAQLFKGKIEQTALVRLSPKLKSLPPEQFSNVQGTPGVFPAYALDQWLRFSHVRPRPAYNPRRKRFEIRISGSPALLGALAIQIMLAMTRSTSIAVCSGCGKPFPPSRRPNPNRNSYCKTCGTKAAWREAQTRRRARKASQGRLDIKQRF